MITQKDLQALQELLNRVPKTTAETLWCLSFLQDLVSLAKAVPAKPKAVPAIGKEPKEQEAQRAESEPQESET